MRILVMIHEYPPVGGGGGRAAEDICLGLARRGHELRVLTARLEGQAQRETRDGVEIIRLNSGRKSAFVASLPAMLRFAAAAVLAGRRMAHKWQPDVIHAHFAVPAGPAARMVSYTSRVPYVLTAHLGDVPGGTPEKTGGWFRWVYPFTPPLWNNAAAVVAVSEYTRQLALKHYPVDIRVIPNGVDLSELQPAGKITGEPPLIVFVGRMVAQKNPLQVVRSLAQLADLSWRCAILGDGPLRAEVEREIGHSGLTERFILTGWIPPEQVIDWMRLSDVLFMPSRSEGLPVTGVQALALGLAIVAGSTGGFIDLVKTGYNGYLVDPEDQAGFTSSLRELLSSERRLQEFKQASREMAPRFDIERVVDQYEALFQEIKARGK